MYSATQIFTLVKVHKRLTQVCINLTMTSASQSADVDNDFSVQCWCEQH